MIGFTVQSSKFMCFITLNGKEICLLDDVHLIETKRLAPPTISTNDHSDKRFQRTNLAGVNSAIMETTTVIVHESMVGSYCW